MNTRINQNPGLQYVSNRSSVSQSKAGPSQGAAQADGTDKVSLSAGAGRLNALSQIAAASPDIDAGKVEAIRNAIANGDYQIDADALANNMLTADRLLGR